MHGALYSYRKVSYTGSQTPVEITCRVHGGFFQVPASHLRGMGCPTCGISKQGIPVGTVKSSTEEFIASALNVHGCYFDYSDVDYRGCRVEVPIGCPVHGMFLQKPTRHLSGAGCPECKKDLNRFPWSQMAVSWIEKESRRRNMKGVMHALNGGEYRIQNTRLRVDGFHARSNTVFEFHGSMWHGDPEIYSNRAYKHPHSRKTARQLYEETCDREAFLVSLGYRVIVIWERDYKMGAKFSYIL